MRIVAVVPMKLNSRRCPNKNMRSFTNGDPLCTYVLKTLLQVKDIDEVFVYCSDASIVQYLPERVTFLQRPEYLDRDSTAMNEVLKSFADDISADIYVMTHVTAPFIKVSSIDKGIKAVSEGQYDSSFAARKIQDFMWQDNRPMNYQLDNIPRTQDLEVVWMETSGFYIYRQNVISDMKRRIGDNPFIVEVDEIESIDIDEKIDFEIADAIYNYFFT